MTQLNLTGGARIGMANATWPFASLKVSKDRLDLRASIVGNLLFLPEDIISIEPYHQIPVIGQGIKINHTIPNYNKKVIFWTFNDPNVLIDQIRQTGFFDNTSPTESRRDSDIVEARQQQGGFPVKKTFAIGIVVIWNILFLMDFLNFAKSDTVGIPLGNGAMTALGIVLLTCFLTLASKGFRKIVLKEGRELKDISGFIYFLMFICGVMLFSIWTFQKMTIN